MKRSPAKKTSWFTVLLLVAAVAIWVHEQKNGPSSPIVPTERTAPVENPGTGASAELENAGDYEVYRNCTLVQARNNDGDSFIVRLPNGKQAELRLYFVDTPESAFKRYKGGESNHKRIRQQAADLGDITPEQAVEVGKKGKAFTLSLLGKTPFTAFTQWDSPFHDNRYHAFIQVRQDGKDRWLHELLIERGLARIITKPADLPNGIRVSAQKKQLRDLERQAKRNETGVWKY